MGYAHVVEPGAKVDLAKIDPDHHGGLTPEEAHAIRTELGERMNDLQELMFAAHMHSMLIVLQGRDTSGKDGAIRSLLGSVNVQSCRVASFKVPTSTELAHDFLWRIHAQAPAKGEIVLFNRSHYEDVLEVRVHELSTKEEWRRRYDHINAFEKLLCDSGTIIVKFLLHISKDEQEKRLMEREQDPDKAWKLNVGDWKERLFWNDFTKAYEDALHKCSTDEAPWYVVPANHKWFRDAAIFEAVVDHLKPYKKKWKESLKELGKRERKELEAYRQAQKKS